VPIVARTELPLIPQPHWPTGPLGEADGSSVCSFGMAQDPHAATLVAQHACVQRRHRGRAFGVAE
jgi:hypothetical protein